MFCIALGRSTLVWDIKYQVVPKSAPEFTSQAGAIKKNYYGRPKFDFCKNETSGLTSQWTGHYTYILLVAY